MAEIIQNGVTEEELQAELQAAVDGLNSQLLNLGTQVAGKAPAAHVHTVAEVGGLETRLQGLETDISNIVASGADHTHGITGIIDFYMASRDVNAFSAEAFWGTSHNTNPGNLPGSNIFVANLSGVGSARGMQVAATFHAGQAFWIRRKSDNVNAPAGQGWQAWARLWCDTDFHPNQFLGVGATAVAASRLAAPFALTLTGAVTGSVNLDGSSNVSINTALAAHSHTLGSLSDVNTSNAAEGQALIKTASGFAFATVASGGVTDHGALTGLTDDDHPQYLTSSRGDGRYYTRAAVDSALTAKADVSHTHDDRYQRLDRVFVSTNHQAAMEQDIAVDTRVVGITITAPANPQENDKFWVEDGKGAAATHNITVDLGGGETFVIDINKFSTGFRYLDGVWEISR